MAHLDGRSPEGAGLFVRMVYWYARRRMGKVPLPVAITAHSPTTLAAMGLFETSFERTKALPLRLKELAFVKVATVVGCRFCIDIGASIAATHGIGEEVLRDLPMHRESTRFTPLERDVLDYAVAMSEAPMEVAPALMARLKAALAPDALVELTAAIAWENYRARFNHAMGAKEEGFFEGAHCLLPPLDADGKRVAHAR